MWPGPVQPRDTSHGLDPPAGAVDGAENWRVYGQPYVISAHFDGQDEYELVPVPGRPQWLRMIFVKQHEVPYFRRTRQKRKK